MRFEIAMDFSSEGLWDLDLVNDNFFLSSRWIRNLGYKSEEFPTTFSDWQKIVHPDDVDNMLAELNQYLETNIGIYESLYRIKAADGKYRLILTRGRGVWEKGRAVRLSGSHNDITEKRELENKLYNLAYYDKITGLPNRAMLESKVNQYISFKPNCRMGVLYIDIDDFKVINEIKGHVAGDSLLKHITKLLTSTITEPNLVGNIVADEFAVIIYDVVNIFDLEYYAQKISKEINNPWECDGQEFYITACIGGSIYPDHGNDFMSILTSADLARNNAKSKGNGEISFFNLSFRNKTLKHVEMSNQLRKAIGNNEITLFYQPQIDIKNNKIIGLEALARWKHRKHGYIPPNVFVPLAEESGMIEEFNECIFRLAFAQIRDWKEKYPNIKVSINLSPTFLKQDGLIIKIKKLMNQYSILPKNIEIEITETAIFDDIEKSIIILRQLQDIGVSIALDDFGSGYSSLTNLQRLPIDVLKIDRGLIKTIGSCEDEAYVLKLIVQMAHHLGLKVIAEGVETKEQLQVVYKNKCDYVQGFYFSKPVSKTKIDSDYIHHII